jgi:hypothetical protein
MELNKIKPVPRSLTPTSLRLFRQMKQILVSTLPKKHVFICEFSPEDHHSVGFQVWEEKYRWGIVWGIIQANRYGLSVELCEMDQADYASLLILLSVSMDFNINESILNLYEDDRQASEAIYIGSSNDLIREIVSWQMPDRVLN